MFGIGGNNASSGSGMEMLAKAVLTKLGIDKAYIDDALSKFLAFIQQIRDNSKSAADNSETAVRQNDEILALLKELHNAQRPRHIQEPVKLVGHVAGSDKADSGAEARRDRARTGTRRED